MERRGETSLLLMSLALYRKKMGVWLGGACRSLHLECLGVGVGSWPPHCPCVSFLSLMTMWLT